MCAICADMSQLLLIKVYVVMIYVLYKAQQQLTFSLYHHLITLDQFINDIISLQKDFNQPGCQFQLMVLANFHHIFQ